MNELANKTKHIDLSQERENPLLSLACNIFLPVFILQKASPHLGEKGPLWALLLALSLPIAYASYDYVKRRHKNYMSLIGVISVLFTGGLALTQADGIWFAVVEMGLPLILGLGVLASAFSSKPFIAKMAYNEMFMQVSKITESLKVQNHIEKFEKLLRTSTLLLSSSFFLSAILNFALAYYIFVPIDSGLPEIQRAEILNNQIADMRYKSIFVIMLPLMAFSIAIMIHLLNGIKRLTGLELDQILKNQ